MTEEHELNSGWILFYHEKNNTKKYNTNTVQLASINTIESFWKVYNNIPKLYDFFNKRIKINSEEKITGSISFFRENSNPTWEHVTNKNGFEWSVRKYLNENELDEYWLNILLTLIGENYEFSEILNGIRIVDCGNYNKKNYRFEFWFNNKDYVKYFEENLKNIFDCFSSEKGKKYNSRDIKLIFRDHDNIKETSKIDF